MGWGGVSQREGGTGQIHPCGMWAPPMADFDSALPRDLAEPFLEGLCLQTPSSPVSLPHLSSQVTVLHLGISSPTPAPSPPSFTAISPEVSCPPDPVLASAPWRIQGNRLASQTSNVLSQIDRLSLPSRNLLLHQTSNLMLMNASCLLLLIPQSDGGSPSLLFLPFSSPASNPIGSHFRAGQGSEEPGSPLHQPKPMSFPTWIVVKPCSPESLLQSCSVPPSGCS